MTKVHPAARTESFTESVIREMTRLAMEHDAVNLSQGFPDFPAPEEVKRAAKDAIDADLNQYPITWGEPEFRGAIAAHYERWYGMEVDQHRQLVVTCGSTEAMMASLLGVIDPGDEVVIFEPYYENYGPDTILSGAVPRYVPLRQPDWTFDEAELAAAFGPRTRGIVVNTPNNPTGKVFSRQELEAIARLCQEWDVIAFTDEIYEHITYDGTVHVPIATIDGMQDRTVTISALSKTYAVTGWRVGWAIA
ncbi:MAG TPA: aminotransferase class I/II-fold pyridoxal phosphate-dependent enzyme, partial [Actinomycetota bacterium]|nr:aminotransferase class I/II-fold pyridoxal phosphate-dependent enzyme [Actinomycetota bacterium]